MTISITTFQTACAACADAIGSQDWGEAARQMAIAKAIHAGLLSMKIGDGGTNDDREQAMAGLKEAIQAAREISSQENSGGMVELYIGRPRR